MLPGYGSASSHARLLDHTFLTVPSSMATNATVYSAVVTATASDVAVTSRHVTAASRDSGTAPTIG